MDKSFSYLNIAQKIFTQENIDLKLNLLSTKELALKVYDAEISLNYA